MPGFSYQFLNDATKATYIDILESYTKRFVRWRMHGPFGGLPIEQAFAVFWKRERPDFATWADEARFRRELVQHIIDYQS